MTVRSRASASRNGIQRGNPPKPARKPSFGPLPAFHTRQEKPFSSTDEVSGSDIGNLAKHKPPPQPSPACGGGGRRRLFLLPPPQAGEGWGGGPAVHPRYSAAIAAGRKDGSAARSLRAIGCGHQRSSHSANRSAICGITF